MKYLTLFVACFIFIQCASTNQNKPYVEATEREYSFDHVDGLPNNVKALVNSDGFKMPQIKGGAEALQKEVSILTEQTPCPVRGRVSVVYVVNEQGQAIDPQTALGIHETCDSIAEKAITQVSFKPATKDGKPIKLQMSNAIIFD